MLDILLKTEVGIASLIAVVATILVGIVVSWLTTHQILRANQDSEPPKPS